MCYTVRKLEEGEFLNKYHCSCLCKANSFFVSLKSLSIEVCHCSMCRKMMGSSGFLGMECRGEIEISKNAALHVYHSSDVGRRGFCQNCGTSLFYYFIPENKFFIPVGVIDDLPEDKVTMTTEIYYDNKPCYYEYVSETKKFTESDFK